MSQIVCKSSKLKSDSYLYKKENAYCDLCQDLKYEDAEHLLMHCKYFNKVRNELMTLLHDIEVLYNVQVIKPLDNKFHLLLGKCPDDVEENVMYEMLRVIAIKVDHMYTVVVKNREGVG